MSNLALPSSKYFTKSFKVGTLIDMGPGFKLMHVVTPHNSASEVIAVFEIDPTVPTEVSIPSNNMPESQHINQPSIPNGPLQSIPLGRR